MNLSRSSRETNRDFPSAQRLLCPSSHEGIKRDFKVGKKFFSTRKGNVTPEEIPAAVPEKMTFFKLLSSGPRDFPIFKEVYYKLHLKLVGIFDSHFKHMTARIWVLHGKNHAKISSRSG